MSNSHIILFLIHVCALEILVVCLRDNECYRTIRNKDDSTYRRINYCCHNYEDKNGQCVECSIGYTSTAGDKCKPCPSNRYGRRCAHACSPCSHNQFCDNVRGCVDLHTTTAFPDTSAKKASSDETFTGQPAIYSTEEFSDFNKNTIEAANNLSELSVRELVIYSLSGAVLLIIVIINLVCVLYCRRKGECPCRKMNVTIGNSNHIHAPRDDVVNGIYDEIEEMGLVQQHIIPSNVLPLQDEKLCGSSDDEIVSETNSYLHPYQPLEDGADTHGYDTKCDDVTSQKAVDKTVYYCVPKGNNRPDCSPYLTAVHCVDNLSSVSETSTLEKPILEKESSGQHEVQYLELFTASEIKQDDVFIFPEITTEDDNKDIPEEFEKSSNE